MTEAVEQLKSLMSPLSAHERADLAFFLLTSLDTNEEDVAEAWREKIASRIVEIRNGTVVGRPVDEVLAELRERYP